MADFENQIVLAISEISSSTSEISTTSRGVLGRHAQLEPTSIKSFEQSSLPVTSINKLREQAVTSDSIDLKSLCLLLVIFVAERDEKSSSPTTNTAFNIAALLPSVLPASGELAIPFAREHLQNIDSADSTCWYLFTSIFAVSYPTQCIKELTDLLSSLTGEGLARCAHLLAILTKQGESTKKASSTYVSCVFDKLAPVFESRLKGLGYDIPKRVSSLVQDRVSIVSNPCIIDLGCGTGLVGELLVPLIREKSLTFSCLSADYRDISIKIKHLQNSIGELLEADPDGKDEDFVSARLENEKLVERLLGEAKVMKENIDATEIIDMYDYDNAPRGSLFGVDLSKEMVKLANAKNCYTSVALADCDDFLKAQGDSSADVIVSADTYIYMGDIDTSLKESARVLKDGGYLVFSVELVPDDTKDGYLLLPSGRYGQSKAYVLSLAEKFSFEVEHAEDIVVRKEQGEDIGGCIYILSMSK
ncbi:hypothetical protein TrCOL_g4855 [Triparma columacea]|uniref:Methyltransferase type 11 domain-containing protein n=1 Tax=Triparma columacea TaxID=722753 RepID=A0A9W7GNC2_9STRA|nr:hypothetical protein TrCOL_g4855 [Triparma columacea]